MTNKLTERLSAALIQAGYEDPRNGNPSIRRMAEELGLNNSRVSRYMYHGSKMQLEAKEQIAEALGMTVSELDSEVQGRKVNTYSPPEAANLLSTRERMLVNELINVLADRHTGEGEEHADGSAAIDRAAGSAAEDELEARRAERGVTRKYTPPWERQETAATEGPDDGTPHDDPGIEDP